MQYTKITRRLAVMVALVMVVSIVATSAFAGSMAGVSPAHNGVAAAEQADCGEDLSLSDAVTSPVGAMVGQADRTLCSGGNLIDSLFGTDNVAEIESMADVNNGIIRDTIEDSQTSWNNDKDAVSPTARSKADGEVIDAHYKGKSEADAKSSGQIAIREEYTAVESAQVNSLNQIIEVAVANSQKTTTAEGVATATKVKIWGGDAGGNYQYAHMSATENSTVKYENITLSDGTEMERVSAITHLRMSGQDNHADTYSPDPADNSDATLVNGTDNLYTVDVSPDSTRGESIILFNPYTGESETFSPFGQHYSRMDELEQMRNDDLQQINNLTAGYYQDYSQGELTPSDASMYSQMQDQAENGGLGYHVLKYIQLGLSVDVDQEHTWTVANETYDGVIATGASNLPKIADADPAPLTGVSLDNVQNEGVLELGNDSQATIKMDADSPSDVSVEVHNVDDVEVNKTDSQIAIDITQSGLEDDFVTFTASSENQSSGTYIVYTSDSAKAEGIPTGLEVGETYDPANFDGAFRAVYNTEGGETIDTTLDSEFTLEKAYGGDGDERTYVLFENERPEKFDSDNVQERLEWQDKMGDIISDPGGGGSDGDGDGPGLSEGIMIGLAVAGALVLLIIFLYLIGNITSVA